MARAQAQHAAGRAVGAQLVGHELVGRRALPLEQLAHEPPGRLGVPLGLDPQIQHLALAVDSAPQVQAPALDRDHDLASRAGESHPHALPEPYVTLSRYTAPDVRPFPCGMENGFALATELLPLPVGSGSRQNTAAPLVQFHYRTFLPPTSCSAPVPRIGTLILAVCAAWTSPFASERQVLTFHTRA